MLIELIMASIIHMTLDHAKHNECIRRLCNTIIKLFSLVYFAKRLCSRELSTSSSHIMPEMVINSANLLLGPMCL